MDAKEHEVGGSGGRPDRQVEEMAVGATADAAGGILQSDVGQRARARSY